MAKKKGGFERRSPNRMEDPPCPMCNTHTNPQNVTVRAAFVFFKCTKCGHVWEMKIPDDYRIRYLDQSREKG